MDEKKLDMTVEATGATAILAPNPNLPQILNLNLVRFLFRFCS